MAASKLVYDKIKKTEVRGEDNPYDPANFEAGEGLKYMGYGGRDDDFGGGRFDGGYNLIY